MRTDADGFRPVVSRPLVTDAAVVLRPTTRATPAEIGLAAPAPATARTVPGWSRPAVAVVYLGLSVLANGSAWTHGIAHTIQTSGGNDVPEEIWFLAQTPWVLLHGHNPLVNNWLNAPVGINLMDNTTMPLFGILGFPITWLFGPIATFNILIDLAIFASAMSFFVMARRFVTLVAGGVRRRPGLRVLTVHRSHGQRAPVPALPGRPAPRDPLRRPLPPVEHAAAHVVRRRRRALLRRPVLRFDRGVRVAGRHDRHCAIVLGGGYMRVETRRRRPPAAGDHRRLRGRRDRARRRLRAPGWPWPGPEHITGPAQPATAIAGVTVDPVGLVVPTLDQRFTFGHAALGDSLVALRDPNWHIVFDSPVENGSYVGVPLLLALVIGGIVLRRKRFALFCTAMGAIALVMSMGSQLHVDGHRTGIPLPFIVIAHLPLLNSSVASRWITYFWLFAALLLALLLDAVYKAVARAAASGNGAAIAWSGLLAWSCPAAARAGVALFRRPGRRPRLVHRRGARPSRRARPRSSIRSPAPRTTSPCCGRPWQHAVPHARWVRRHSRPGRCQHLRTARPSPLARGPGPVRGRCTVGPRRLPGG